MEMQTPWHQNMSIAQGPVTILWDIENCRMPSGVRAEDVARNIRLALHLHPVIDGTVQSFSAYGDFNGFPRRLREGWERTGVKFIDVPNGRKDATDKAILIDMFLFALENRPPSCIVLISGDVDFAPALHILGQRGYTIFLGIPSSTTVSPALISGGRFIWDWPSVARGEGFCTPRARTSGDLMGCPANGYTNDRNEEESHKAISKGIPGGLNGLKAQLVNLLVLLGGALPMTRLAKEYHKLYGATLDISNYGATKLVKLLKKMPDAITVEGRNHKKVVRLRVTKEKRSPDNGVDENMMDREESIRRNVDRFKYELQEILVSYSCQVYLNCFEAVYEQRYKRKLDYAMFGVNRLEELLERVGDAVVNV